MDSIFSFSQLFAGNTPTQTHHKADNVDQGPVYTAVPEAPVYEDIPDFDFFLKGPGDGYTSSQVKADKTKSKKPSKTPLRGNPVFGKRKSEPVTLLPERAEHDEDRIYLGSQYPIVHHVRASQADRLRQNGDIQVLALPYDNTQSEQEDNGGEAWLSQGSDRADVEPQRTASVQPRVADQRSAGDMQTTPSAIILPTNTSRGGFRLRSVQEISELYRKIFNFPYFNIVQSKVFDDVMYTDRPLVLCSPTGSGKTAVFEMAIVRLLQQSQAGARHNMKVVYMAPIKALCSEKYTDWKAKFEPCGLKVMELTGDTDTDDFYELQQVNIILTTPEKWDSMTRKWRDNRSVIEAICLFLIDEIHVLNDATRGATVEAVLSRMKTIQAAKGRTKSAGTAAGQAAPSPGLRFLAVSATITNIEDLAEWLGSNKDNPALFYKFDDSVRPVRLRKVVMGFYFAEGKQSEFQFDLTLGYKMTGIINTYSENKPTLVFCATRKGAIQGAEILGKDGKHSYIRHGEHRKMLQNFSFHIKDTKLRDLVAQGIGYHHAGMDLQDRKSIEQIFADGDLPVLVATSTLAMGVNLPAHLVIIKSTMYYHLGCHQEYSDTQVLQMIGRAGRPQFDTSATAVIMTKNQTKMKYENLINGTQLLESSLHKNLIEHLNAEIVLHTITDISVAVEWLKYTFLYIRVMKNPLQYGLQTGLTRNQIEKKLQEMCMQCLNQLHGLNLIHMDQETMDVKPTENGRLMARYCISYRTAELFHSIGATETVADLLGILSKSEEFEDIILRNNEKKTLNTLNRDKNRLTIRHPMTGKIKTTEMKVNCLIQAQFGCLLVQDFALQQDAGRIFRAGMRVARCLVEFLSQKNDYKSLLSAVQLSKCFKAKLWEDSKYVSRQLEGIGKFSIGDIICKNLPWGGTNGPTLSTAMVNAGLVTFEKIEQTNPREIELIVNRHPPFGNQVRSSVAKLPKYEIVIEQSSRYSAVTAEIVVTVQLANRAELQDAAATTNHKCTLLIGDHDNHIVYKQRIMDKLLLKEASWCKRLEVRQANQGPELHIHYISQDLVGLDVDCTYTPNYLGGKRITSSSVTPSSAVTPKVAAAAVPENLSASQQQQVARPCQHSCHNKRLCAHECCKTGVSTKRRPAKTALQQQQSHPPLPPPPSATRSVSSHLNELRNKTAQLAATPSLAKRVRMNPNEPPVIDLTRYAYTTNKAPGLTKHDNGSAVNCVERRTGGTTPHSYQTPVTNKPKQRDWAELDMYQKHREKYQTEVTRSYMDDDSLPDIDQAPRPYPNPALGWQAGNVPEEIWEDDFVQETDYGYTYVHGQDQGEVPADWDDTVGGQLHSQTGTRNPSAWDNTVGGQLHSQTGTHNPSAWDDTGGGQLYNKLGTPNSRRIPGQLGNAQGCAQGKSVRGNFHCPGNRQTHTKLPSPAIQHPRYSTHTEEEYAIEDFSDEECDNIGANSEQRLTVPHNLYPADNNRQKKFTYNRGAVRTGISRQETYDLMNNRNLPKHCAPKSRFDSITPFTDEALFDTDDEYLAVAYDNAESSGYRQEVEAGVEVDNAGMRVASSRWDSYCSTQETSVSDCLNWQYPARVAGEVVMENRGSMAACPGQTVAGRAANCQPEGTNSGHNQEEEAALKQSTTEQSHKYGQVLAWVSDNENQGSGPDQSPEWEPWGSQDELVAQADPAPNSKPGQSLVPSGEPAPSSKLGKTPVPLREPALISKPGKTLVPWARSDSDTPLKEAKKANPAVLKKPKFTSFFSKEPVEAPVEGFYNIFEGIF